MRYRVKHVTEYLYANRVSHCYNMAHQIPRSTLRQKCLHSEMRVEPTTSFTSKREDYFGNFAYHFEIQRPHKKLVITSVSEVDTGPQHTDLQLDLGVTCAEAKHLLKTSSKHDVLLAREFMLDSPMVKANQELLDYAQSHFDQDRPLLSAVMDLTHQIYNEFTYCPESTTLATPCQKSWQIKKGYAKTLPIYKLAAFVHLVFPLNMYRVILRLFPHPEKKISWHRRQSRVDIGLFSSRRLV